MPFLYSIGSVLPLLLNATFSILQLRHVSDIYFLQVKLNNMLFHTARINCVAWSPNNTMVATGSLDTCVIIYEIGKPASSRITIKCAHLGGVYGLHFTDDSNVVSSGEDGFIRVWKVASE